jgi:predicted enzyme related to lactoylglutathione lyase
MPTVQFFEIPADNLERAKKFYGNLFGWKMKNFDNNTTNLDSEYLMFETADENGKPGIGGGMMKRQHPQQMICNFVTVRSIDECSAKVEQLGGKILVPKMAAKGHGYFVVCSDTESNHFGIFQQDPNAK